MPIDVTEDFDHSPLGASSMKRWATCAPSYELSKKAKPARPSVYAAAGTVAHSIGEAILKAPGKPNLDKVLLDLEGKATDVQGHTITADADLLRAVRHWVSFASGVIHEASWHAIEARVCLDDYFSSPPPVSLFGTADLIAYQAKLRRLGVADFKSGSGIDIEARDNPQLYYYAAGALRLAPGPVDEIMLVIVQPNASHDRMEKHCTIPTIDLLLWIEDVLKPAVARVSDPLAPLVTGDHCRFCPARAFCPALADIARRQALHEFTAIPEEVDALDEVALATALNEAETAEIWIKAVREEAKQRLEEGTQITGWGLVPTRPQRSWDELQADAVVQALRGAGLWPREIFEPERLRSPAQIERLCRDKNQRRLWGDVSTFVRSQSSGTKLARVVTQAEREFDAVPEDEVVI